jgi:hypothetical protein
MIELDDLKARQWALEQQHVAIQKCSERPTLEPAPN